MKTTEIRIRDPYIFVSEREQRYYLFGTTDTMPWGNKGEGFNYFISKDLTQWEGPFAAFDPPRGFWGSYHFWAPEVHFYDGSYYMFASFKADSVCRGTQILRAEALGGNYKPIHSRPETPPDWECLDGTFFTDENKEPWMIFCREWLQVGDGQIYCTRLSENMEPVGNPQLMFSASQALWTVPVKDKASGKSGFITDGPFVYRTHKGHLLLLWSSMSKDGYAVGVSRSLSGKITGPWEHIAEPIYSADGGHSMIFKTLEGKLILALHSPNKTPYERPVFLPLHDDGNKILLKVV